VESLVTPVARLSWGFASKSGKSEKGYSPGKEKVGTLSLPTWDLACEHSAKRTWFLKRKPERALRLQTLQTEISESMPLRQESSKEK